LLTISILVITILMVTPTMLGYDPSLAVYTWDATVPNYNPTANIHPGTLDGTQLCTGDFRGIGPNQPNAPGYGDSGISVNWDDNWVMPVGHPNTNGDYLDGLWVQMQYPAQGWWDMGTATDQVVIFTSQDHGPYLSEGLEYRVYGSNTLWGALSTQAALTDVYLDGWRPHNPAEDANGNGWCSDDIAGVFKLPGMYRYVVIEAWNPSGSYSEPEIDAVAIADSLPPDVYKEHPEHGYVPEEQEKVAIVPAPWQYWTTFVGGVTDIIVWDPPETNESVAIVREYATSLYEIPLDNLTWENPMIEELNWILIDDEPVIIPPGGNISFDIPTTEDDAAVLVRYTVAWASTPDMTEAHFINEAILESSSPQVIIGQLSNFDVHNFLDIPVDNFELELYGIQPSDVVDWYYSHAVPAPQPIPRWWGVTWYGGWGNSPQITTTPDGTEVKWKEFNHPAQPCEWVHFGLRLKPNAQPWGVKAYWTKIISPPYLKSCAPLILWAEDLPEICGSGVEGIYYGFWYEGDGMWHPMDPTDEYCGNYNITVYKYGRWWYTYTRPIHFHEECIHKLHYWARDNVGNQGPVYKQVYYVDDTPPNVYKEHPDHGYYVDPTTGTPYLKLCAPIELWAEDGGTPPCISGVEDIFYGFWYNETWHPTGPTDEYCGNYNITMYKHDRWWYTYTRPIHFHEECIHTLEYWAKDNVCNQGPIHEQTYHVDGTPPTITKTHPDDYRILNDTAGWIKVCSKITLEAEDNGTPPCISGVEDIYWGFTFNGVWHPTDPTDTYDGNIVTMYKHDRWWYTYDSVKRFIGLNQVNMF